MADAVFVTGFMLVWFVLFFGAIGGLVFGVVALVSAAQTPSEAFGPWWDNTKTAWLLGIAISYLIPFGLWFTAIYWFRTGKRGLQHEGIVGRPFWAGPIKPYPPTPVPWYPMPQPWPEAHPGWVPPDPAAADVPGDAARVAPAPGRPDVP